MVLNNYFLSICFLLCCKGCLSAGQGHTCSSELQWSCVVQVPCRLERTKTHWTVISLLEKKKNNLFLREPKAQTWAINWSIEHIQITSVIKMGQLCPLLGTWHLGGHGHVHAPPWLQVYPAEDADG